MAGRCSATWWPRCERGRSAARAGHGRALVRLGPPLPGTDIRVVDPTAGPEFDAPLPERHVARVEARGGSVISDGRLDTGDLGYLADGELVVCGHAKDVLFAVGRNVHLCDVEVVVSRIDGVPPGQVAAFGVPGRNRRSSGGRP